MQVCDYWNLRVNCNVAEIFLGHLTYNYEGYETYYYLGKAHLHTHREGRKPV